MNLCTTEATVYHTAGNSVISGSDKSSEQLHQNILAQLLLKGPPVPPPEHNIILLLLLYKLCFSGTLFLTHLSAQPGHSGFSHLQGRLKDLVCIALLVKVVNRVLKCRKSGQK